MDSVHQSSCLFGESRDHPAVVAKIVFKLNQREATGLGPARLMTSLSTFCASWI